MTAPTFFTVVADYKSVVVDLAADVDADPQLGPITAKVTFTPVLAKGDVILATDASPRPTGYVGAPIVARIDTDGRLKLRVEPDGDRDNYANLAAFPATGVAAKVYYDIAEETFYRWNGSAYVETLPYAEVRLLADTALLELDTDLYYKVTFSEVTFNGASGYISPFVFQAPTSDTVLNLIEVTPVPGQPAVGITKGDKGDQGYSFVGLAPAGDGTSVVGLIETEAGVVPSGEPIAISLAYNSTVTHAAVASTPRPPVSVAVIWIGSVQPDNALDGDVWMDTSGTAPTITTTSISLNRGVVVDQVLLATGSTPITWTVISGTLPAGLALSSAGNLTGNPSAAGSYSFTARATNGYGSTTNAYSGTVGSYVTPTILTTELGGVLTSGQDYLQVLMSSGSIPVTWSIVSGSLPDGLALSSTAGTISGAPTSDGSYTFTLRATNAGGYDDQEFTGSISGTAPTITTTSLNSLSQGAAFSQIPAATGTAPFVWSIISGSLPSGLSLNTATGAITGTPSSSGSYSVTLRATNPYGHDDQAYTGTVASGTPSVTTSTLSTIYRAVAFSETLAFTGATGITWSVSSGSLPTGISLNTSTGVLSGSATTVAAYNFTITATNSYGSGTKTFTGNVLQSSPGITETSLNTLRATQAFSQTLTGTGVTPITWSITAGSLPTGLSLNSTSGVISGTPTATGAYSVTIRATNSVSFTDRTFTGNVLNLGVSFSAAGTYGQSTAGTTYSINGPSAAIGDTVVVWIEWNASSTPTFSATYDGAAMTAKGGVAFSTGVFGLSCLTITGVSAAGVKTIAVTSSVTATMRVYSVAYSGATSVGTLTTANNANSASLTQTVSSSTGNMVAQAFGHYPNNNTGSVSSYSQTQRNNVSAAISIYTINFVVGDAAGASSLTFNATAANTGAYATAAIELVP